MRLHHNGTSACSSICFWSSLFLLSHFFITFPPQYPLPVPHPMMFTWVVHPLQDWAPQFPHGYQPRASSLHSSTSSHPNFSARSFLQPHPSLWGGVGRFVPALQSRWYGRARSAVPWGNLQSTSCYYSLQQNNQRRLCNAVRWIEAA